jgi:Ca2+-binding RTX toxin-like protein
LKGAKGKTINVATIAATGVDTTVGDTLTPDISGQPQETLPPDETLEPDDSKLTYNAGKTAVTLASDFTGTLNESGYASTTKTIDATKVSSGIKIYGNSLKNSIAGGTGNDTLIGGAGNDTLTGGSGKDIFVHSYGKDIITDYVVGTDKIKIEDGEVFDYRVTGSDVILYTDNGSVCVKNGKDKQITVIDEYGNETKETYKAAENVTVPANVIPAGVSVKGAVLSISTVFSGNSLNLENYDTAVTKVDASKLSKAVEIVGNTSNNSIKGGKGADTINGGVGKDTIFGGNGNDVINGGSDNDVLKGEVGNDSLYGGTGNDTLTGGAGNDVFAY